MGQRGVDEDQRKTWRAGLLAHRLDQPDLPSQAVQGSQHTVARPQMNVGRSPRPIRRKAWALGRWLALAVTLNEFEEIRRKFGKIGQGFMNHDRFRGGGYGRTAPRGTPGRYALALHHKDPTVLSA